MTDFPPSPFWDFSLAVYGRAGVAPACLDLQERRGADVNLLLFCAWLGTSGRGRIDDRDLDALTAEIGEWHETVVRHLRRLRVGLRGGLAPAPNDLVQSLRARLQKVEIDAEHVEQVMLTAWAATRPPAEADPGAAARLGDAAAGMAAYVRRLGGGDEADRDALAVVLAACAAEAGAADTVEIAPLLAL